MGRGRSQNNNVLYARKPWARREALRDKLRLALKQIGEDQDAQPLLDLLGNDKPELLYGLEEFPRVLETAIAYLWVQFSGTESLMRQSKDFAGKEFQDLAVHRQKQMVGVYPLLAAASALRLQRPVVKALARDYAIAQTNMSAYSQAWRATDPNNSAGTLAEVLRNRLQSYMRQPGLRYLTYEVTAKAGGKARHLLHKGANTSLCGRNVAVRDISSTPEAGSCKKCLGINEKTPGHAQEHTQDADELYRAFEGNLENRLTETLEHRVLHPLNDYFSSRDHFDTYFPEDCYDVLAEELIARFAVCIRPLKAHERLRALEGPSPTQDLPEGVIY